MADESEASAIVYFQSERQTSGLSTEPTDVRQLSRTTARHYDKISVPHKYRFTVLQ